jgi:hypothetical protein
VVVEQQVQLFVLVQVHVPVLVPVRVRVRARARAQQVLTSQKHQLWMVVCAGIKNTSKIDPVKDYFAAATRCCRCSLSRSFSLSRSLRSFSRCSLSRCSLSRCSLSRSRFGDEE